MDQPGSFFELTMSPGEQRELAVELTNHGETAVSARTYRADVYSIVNGGFGARLHPDPDTGATLWLNYTEDVLELGPGDGVTRTFLVTVPPDVAAPIAVVGGWAATGLLDVTSDLSALDGRGFWVVVVPFAGPPVCARFARRRPFAPGPMGCWRGPAAGEWSTSLDRDHFVRGVESIRAAIAAGDAHQVNLTRRLSAPLPAGAEEVATRSAAARARRPGGRTAVPVGEVDEVRIVSAWVAAHEPPELLLDQAADDRVALHRFLATATELPAAA
ncbi:MAG: DUF916 domain-containing protein [Actinobacteria bacterium]|nr:DUF916 domain-containing protein [Actinomycetota bacterium]